MVQYDRAGKPFTVYYPLLTPMLLKEAQKEHRTTEEWIEALKAQESPLAVAKQARMKIALRTLRRAALFALTLCLARVRAQAPQDRYTKYEYMIPQASGQ